MANAGRAAGKATFPVWVGSLDERVTEKQLSKAFSKFGNVSSVKIQRDGATGKSKGFGWVNFHTSEAAELSATKMAGATLYGSVIKTRGPKSLEKKGLFSPPPSKVDYRPLTDCSYFIQGRKCKKGATCEYRHSEKALQIEVVCPNWRERKCHKKNCTRRHPAFSSATRKSNSSSGGSPPPFPEPVSGSSGGGGGGGGVGVLVCGGRCGDDTCSLSFSSAVTLMQHIQLSQLLCTACNIVCSSQAELQDHKMTCPRTHRDSSSTQSLSISDVEILSDTSESISSEDEDGGGGGRGGSMLVTPQKRSSYQHTASVKGAGWGKSEKEGSSGGTRRGKKKKNKGGISSPRSVTNLASSTGKTPTMTRMRKASSEAVRLGTGASDLYFSGTNSTYPSESGLLDDEGEIPTDVHFGVGSDSSDSSDDDEYDNLEYTPAEMAQLLSLNELDMQPGSDESEVEDEEEEEEERGEVGVKKRHWQRRKTNEPDTPPSPGPKTSQRQKQSNKEKKSSAAAASVRQLEPVGLFWDIENCSVPVNKSAFSVAAKMRRVFFEGKREAEFMVVCDITKERKEVVDALNKAQVTLVHVNAVAKNAADDKLRQSLRRFAHTYPAPSTVVLVSSDINFSSELNDLRHVHNMTIVLMHSRATSDALKVFAQQLVSYEEFLQDIESPKGQQQPTLPNVLLVTNLPRNFNPKKLSNRLGQLSDNCGGRVLSVDPPSGTARILFCTYDWAVKAEKRMRGEDVFGSRINLTVDYSQPIKPPPQQTRLPPQNHQINHPPPLLPPSPSQYQTRLPPGPHGFPPQQFHRPPRPGGPPGPPGGPHLGFHRISGPALGNTFPPAIRSPPAFPPSPLLHGPLARPRVPPSPPPSLLRGPQPGPPRGPLPYPGPPQPRIPLPQGPRVPSPASYSNVAAIPPPPPEGKILIIKIPVSEQQDLFKELKRQAVMITLEANIKMEQDSLLVLWHSFSELQLLLRLDFRGTAVVRKEELIRDMWDEGNLKPKVAKDFVDQCVKSLEAICQHQGLTWQVNSCGWSTDEEEERLTKSRVIDLLRQFPHCWLKWTRFKKKYNECYRSALSEMAVHTCCKGVVMIIGNPENNQSQVIIRYEMSPLVRIPAQRKIVTAVQKKVVDMISTRPEQKIKLLDVVREYTKEVGALPHSSSGKSLQDVLKECPRLRFVGNKPSSIFLTLSPSVMTQPLPPPPPPPATPPLPLPPPQGKTISAQRPGNGNLGTLSAEFRHLLKKQSPPYELPLSRLQQEYQTLYHHSFKVLDYIQTGNGEGSKMRSLVEACSGIGLKEVKVSKSKMETVVYLESEQGTATAVAVASAANDVSKVQSQAAPLPAPPDTVADCEKRVRDLLCGLPGYQITQDRFMTEYEKKYDHRMSYYGHSKLTGLLETFTSTLILSQDKGPSRLIRLHPFAIFNHELCLLLSANGGKLAMSQVVPAYREKFGKNLNFSQFGFNKLIKALEALQDSIAIEGTGASRIAVLKQPLTVMDPATVDQFTEELSLLLMSTHNKRKTMAELTSNYNEVFRGVATAGKLPPISISQMANTVSKLPGFKVTGAGPVQYVTLVQQPSKNKEKNKPPQKATSEPLEPNSATNKKPTPTKDPVSLMPKRSETQPLPPSHLETGAKGRDRENKPLFSTDIKSPTGNSEQSDGEDGLTLLRFSNRESQRLTSETQRLLMSHPEHSMTISELVQSYREGCDPAEPSLEELSLCLHKHNVKRGNSKLFQISSIPGALGDSLIQLNRPDCIAKLGHDLIYLFIIQPSPQMDLSLDEILSLYRQCYGRKLNPGVYGMKTLQGLIQGEGQLSLLFKLDETKQVCSLADLGFQRVMSSLLVELLFLGAGKDGESLDNLPRLFRQHFCFPLPLNLRGMESVSSLLNLKDIQSHFEVEDSRVVLKEVHRFSEELRFLLTRLGGRISLSSLPDIYQSTFGSPPPERDGKKDWLKKKLTLYAPHVLNLTGNQWVIWAPAGRPYPSRPLSKLLPSQMPFSAHAGAGFKDSVEVREGSKCGAIGVDPLIKPSSTHQSNHPTTDTHASQSKKTIASQPAELYPVSELASLLHSDRPREDGPLPSSPPSISEIPHHEDLIVFDDSPYGFLQKDPDFLTQLNVKEEDERNAMSTDEALRRLIEAGSGLFDLPPPLVPNPFSSQCHTSSASGAREASPSVKENSFGKETPLVDEGEGTTDYFKTVRNPREGTAYKFTEETTSGEGASHYPKTKTCPDEEMTDYLKAGLKPDQVLEELYRVKDKGGGVINPASMEPFLNYFGELSSRELERLESLGAKEEKLFSPPPLKGLHRNKQKMAIRFPGQDPGVDPELEKTLAGIKLPEISLDSSDDESYPMPVTREELFEKLLNGKISVSQNKEEDDEEDNIV